MNKREYFISGIDTDCGKTYITGLLAYHLKKAGVKVITTKLVQTGCQGVSEDIIEHRRIMECNLLPEDKSLQTCPFVYSFPASPHLAASIDNKIFDANVVRESTKELFSKFDFILAEGAGGLLVPITENYTTINYISDNKLPLILVSSSKLGSINHTLLSIELCLAYNIDLKMVIFNKMPNHSELIANDSFNFLCNYIDKKNINTKVLHGDQLAKHNNNSAINTLIE